MIDVKVWMPSGYWADGKVADGQDLSSLHIMVSLPQWDHAMPVHRSRVRLVQKETK